MINTRSTVPDSNLDGRHHTSLSRARSMSALFSYLLGPARVNCILHKFFGFATGLYALDKTKQPVFSVETEGTTRRTISSGYRISYDKPFIHFCSKRRAQPIVKMVSAIAITTYIQNWVATTRRVLWPSESLSSFTWTKLELNIVCALLSTLPK